MRKQRCDRRAPLRACCIAALLHAPRGIIACCPATCATWHYCTAALLRAPRGIIACCIAALLRAPRGIIAPPHRRVCTVAWSRGRASWLHFRILNCSLNRILRARFRRLLRTASAHMRYMVTTGYSTVNLGYSRVRFRCYEGTPGVLPGAPQRHSERRRRGRAHQRLELCTHHFVRITHHTYNSAPAHGYTCRPTCSPRTSVP